MSWTVNKDKKRASRGQRPQQLKGAEEGLEKRNHVITMRLHYKKSLCRLGLNFPVCEMGVMTHFSVLCKAHRGRTVDTPSFTS